MRWEERLLSELDDLEQQAEGLHLAERDATVAELRVSTYAEVELAARLHASLGLSVQLRLVSGAAAEGVLTRAGRDWLLLSHGRSEYVVPLAAILGVRGASGRAVPDQARSVLARLGLGSVLRQVAAAGEPVSLRMVGGELLRGRVVRVGRDFLELEPEGEGGVELVGLGGLVLLRRG